MKIALLCNNRIALPTLQKMAGAGVLSAIGITDMHKEVVSLYSGEAAAHRVPLTIFSKKSRNAVLKEWVVGMDAVFMMTFPWRIPKEVFSIPRYGFLNFHGGLLPEMRGSDPIFETIRNKKGTAGMTVHQVEEDFDTGGVILREETQVQTNTTYGMLSTQLAYLGAEMSLKVVEMIGTGAGLTSQPQNEAMAKYWPVATPKDIFINWGEMDAANILALVNACNPVLRSGAATFVNGWGIGVCFASLVALQGDAFAYSAGTILVSDHQHGMIVYCRDGVGLKLDVVFAEEGFFPGYMLHLFGIRAGMSFA